MSRYYRFSSDPEITFNASYSNKSHVILGHGPTVYKVNRTKSVDDRIIIFSTLEIKGSEKS